jgi:exodeoxyribonuclease VII large subunit
MAFNDERVIRRLARVSVPVVSAVGHEIDVTLTDLVADVRAATPSQAAELAVHDAQALGTQLRRCLDQLARVMQSRLYQDAATMSRLRGRLGDPRFVIAERQQRLDEVVSRLERRSTKTLGRHRSNLEGLSRRLGARHPRVVVAQGRVRLGPLATRLRAALRLRLGGHHARFGRATARLDGLSPLSVLRRGYAIAARRDGEVLRTAAGATVGQPITVRLHQGCLDATVTGARFDPPVPSPQQDSRFERF